MVNLLQTDSLKYTKIHDIIILADWEERAYFYLGKNKGNSKFSQIQVFCYYFWRVYSNFVEAMETPILVFKLIDV